MREITGFWTGSVAIGTRIVTNNMVNALPDSRFRFQNKLRMIVSDCLLCF